MKPPKFSGKKGGKKTTNANPPMARKSPTFPQQGGSRGFSKVPTMKGLGGPPC